MVCRTMFIVNKCSKKYNISCCWQIFSQAGQSAQLLPYEAILSSFTFVGVMFRCTVSRIANREPTDKKEPAQRSRNATVRPKINTARGDHIDLLAISILETLRNASHI